MLILSLISLLVAIVFGVITLVKAFEVSVLWGLAYIFIPLASFVFIVMHWETVKKPVIYSIVFTLLAMPGLLTSMPENLLSNDGGAQNTADDSLDSFSDMDAFSAGIDKKQKPLENNQDAGWQLTSVKNLPSLINKNIKVKTLQGSERMGVLTKINKKGMFIKSSENVMNFVRAGEIASMQVEIIVNEK
jgi:hypothetical protein